MKLFIKKLLRERLEEAVPMGHFKERMAEVVGDIQSIEIPANLYLPNIPKEQQDAWIIAQIKARVTAKTKAVEAKDYPETRGSCVLVPLGIIKLQPLKGNPTNILVKAQRKEGIMSGYSYYITIYENRMPTIVLADPKIPANSSIGNQLQAHIANTIKGGWPVSKDKSFIDKSFMDNIIINLAEFKI